MSSALFERYRNALRNGHLAAAHGRLGDALVAYREAIGLAGDRTLPYAALADVYLRLGDAERALETCDEALELDPRDEPALVGRARALETLDRSDEAAETFDRLAETLGMDGRLEDACTAVRRAMAHRSTPARRHRLQDLTRTIKLAGGDREAELALGRALGLVRTPDGDLEMAPPAAVSPRDAARRIAVEAAEQEAADEAAALAGPGVADAAREPAGAVRVPGEDPADEAPAQAVDAAPAEAPAGEPADEERPAEGFLDARSDPAWMAEEVLAGGASEIAAPADDALRDIRPATEAAGSEIGSEPEPPVGADASAGREPPVAADPPVPPVPAMAPAFDDAAEPPAAPAARRPLPVVDPEALVVAAEESALRGDAGSSVVAAMLAARAFLARDAANAALDACTSALAVAPAHVDLHLLIAELYIERGWHHLAGETYQGLLRLTQLDDDTAAHAKVLEAARSRLPGDPRFMV